VTGAVAHPAPDSFGLEDAVVEMRFRCVRRHLPTGSDVAVLGPAAASTPADRPMIALTL
jgi:hypothetical protein